MSLESWNDSSRSFTMYTHHIRPTSPPIKQADCHSISWNIPLFPRVRCLKCSRTPSSAKVVNWLRSACSKSSLDQHSLSTLCSLTASLKLLQFPHHLGVMQRGGPRVRRSPLRSIPPPIPPPGAHIFQSSSWINLDLRCYPNFGISAPFPLTHIPSIVHRSPRIYCFRRYSIYNLRSNLLKT